MQFNASFFDDLSLVSRQNQEEVAGFFTPFLTRRECSHVRRYISNFKLSTLLFVT
ncbi:hypothetical protein A2U01_0031364, partial [Trifolium medium]|nr:hypothetical protein [Trifolium medium]